MAKTGPNDCRFITKIEIAARLEVSTRTIDSWMAKKIIPFRKIGRTVRFDWLEVCDCLKARSQVPETISVIRPGEGIAGLLRERAIHIRKTEAQVDSPKHPQRLLRLQERGSLGEGQSDGSGSTTP